MHTKIQRWGNSLGLRIPQSMAADVGVAAGSEVDVRVRGGNLVVKPAQRRTYRLADLLAGVTSGNLHREVETGAPVGREVW